MKKENLFKLLNKGKRLNHFEPVKPKKYTLKSIIYKYTGLKVLKARGEDEDDPNNDNEVYQVSDVKGLELSEKLKNIFL